MEDIVQQSRVPCIAYDNSNDASIESARHSLMYIEEVLNDLQVLFDNAETDDDITRWLAYQKFRLEVLGMFYRQGSMWLGTTSREGLAKLQIGLLEFKEQLAAGNDVVNVARGMRAVEFSNQNKLKEPEDRFTGKAGWIGNVYMIQRFARYAYGRNEAFRAKVQSFLREHAPKPLRNKHAK